jgi:Zn-dependent M32 family carboxypeptidase
MRKVVIISTKNPTQILLECIRRYKIFYKDFDIIIIDSNSTDVEIFNEIPKDVIIDYAKNNNYVSGAWKYAINKYDYDLYLFVQDTLIPLARIEGIDIIRDFSNIIYDIPYTAEIGKTNNDINYEDLERLRNTYRDTKFDFISKIPAETYIKGMEHTSFLANKENSKKLIELEDVYKRKGIIKEKIDCNFSERTFGILADYLKLDRLIMTTHFHKINGGRK